MSDPLDHLWDTSYEFHTTYASLPKQEWLDDEEAWIDEGEPLPESNAPRRLRWFRLWSWIAHLTRQRHRTDQGNKTSDERKEGPMDSRISQEYSSAYFVQDRSNQAEKERLAIQDAFITAGMGGVLPEQPDPSVFRRVLDVGCGTGGWLIAVAQAYPQIEHLVGVDISHTMVADARSQAEAAHVSDRVTFVAMDALRMLEFPTGFFDLINQRAGASYLRTWEWAKLLQEYRRVAHRDGTIRITEFDLTPTSTSPALTQLCHLLTQALYHAGHLFTPESQGITDALAHLLTQHGCEQVQTRICTLDYRVGTSQGLLDDVRIGFRTLLPFLQRWTVVPESYEDLYQQALTDIQLPTFVGTGRLLTAWGKAHG